MPYQFEFDSTNRVLRGRLDGRVTDEVAKEYHRAAKEYASHIDPRLGITDLSAVTSFEVSPETARELARSEPVMPDPNNRISVIIAPSDHIFDMARLFQLEGEQTRPNLHVVHTLMQAWAILGVQDPQFERLQTK
jgi:hypothetical protein